MCHLALEVITGRGSKDYDKTVERKRTLQDTSVPEQVITLKSKNQTCDTIQ